MKINKISALPIIASVLFAGAAQATVVSYASRTAYNTAITADAALVTSVETWDAYPAGTIMTNQNGIQYSTTRGALKVGCGGLATSGTCGLDVFINGGGNPIFASDILTFTFAAPILAFAIDFNSFANTANAYLATTNLGDIVGSVFNVFPGAATGEFLGFQSDTAFSSITLRGASANIAAYGLDTLRYARAAATPVPEPASFMLLGLGLAGLACLGRRAHAN